MQRSAKHLARGAATTAVRLRVSLLAVASIAALGGASLVPSAHAIDVSHVANPSVVQVAGGGYITTFTAPNGDVTKVFSAVPVTISRAADTSRQITANGSKLTEHAGGVAIRPVADVVNKAAIRLGSTLTPYEELLALGAAPADIASLSGLDDKALASYESPSLAMPATSNSGGGTQIGPPVCIDQDFDGGHGHIYGCDVTRKVGTGANNVWYLTDATQSTGTMHDTGCFFCDHFTGLRFGTTYGSGNTIQSWKPTGTRDIGNCVKDTVSLQYKGVGVSSTGNQCPETFGVYTVSAKDYSTKWDGKGDGPSDGARDTHQVDGVYNGSTANPFPGVYADWWYTSN